MISTCQSRITTWIASFFVPCLGSLLPGQMTWTPRFVIEPNIVDGSAMVYDSARRRAVLFGGWVGPVNSYTTVSSQTWEWDGSGWVLSATGAGPSSRAAHSMAFDSTRGRTVLFGGVSANGVALPGTWEWNGASWVSVAASSSPSLRCCSAVAFDSNRGVTVLFGGSSYPQPSVALADTWEFDGTGWVQRTPSTVPPARWGHAMAFDARRGRVVLWGGTSGTDGVWEWDGSDWLLVQPASSPIPRRSHSLSYDAARGRTVLFGGETNPGPLNDVWEWDGVSWVERTPLGFLAPRYSQVMAYESARGRSLVFGGWVQFSQGTTTWELAAPVDTIGDGHAGGGIPLNTSTVPQVGGSLCLDFLNPLNSGWLVIGPAPALFPPIPVSPPAACSPAFLHAWPAIILPLTGNPASLCLPIPNLPAYGGLAFCLQGFTSVGTCLLATDAIVATIQ